MLGTFSEYLIPFAGLKIGNHQFKFELGEAFFANFEYSEIGVSQLMAEVNLDRRANMLVFDIHITGTAKVHCDRCQDNMDLELDHEDQLIVRFGDHTSGYDEEIIILGPHEHEFDLKQFLYEFSHLALPPRRVHENKEDCNQDIIAFLEDMRDEEEESNDTDPRWEMLKKLKGK